MRVKDRKQLAKLMAIQEVSHRKLAAIAGWRSHTYVNRIISGQITTVTPERAARIARHLGVGIDDLFLPRLSTDTRRTAKRDRAA